MMERYVLSQQSHYVNFLIISGSHDSQSANVYIQEKKVQFCSLLMRSVFHIYVLYIHENQKQMLSVTVISDVTR